MRENLKAELVRWNWRFDNNNDIKRRYAIRNLELLCDSKIDLLKVKKSIYSDALTCEIPIEVVKQEITVDGLLNLIKKKIL